MQLWRNANARRQQYTHLHYAGIQVHNCVGISVCKFAIYVFIDARKQIWRYVCMKKYASM